MEATVSLSIKNVPPVLAKALGDRARRNHRSVQGELMRIIEEAVGTPPRRFDAMRLVRQAKALGLTTDADSVEIIREWRDRE